MLDFQQRRIVNKQKPNYIMDLRAIKKIYFATVCFPFPLYVLHMFIGSTFPINPSASAILKYYFVIGIILLLLDFWSSKNHDSDEKIWWSIMSLIFSPIILPIFWFKFFRRNEGKNESSIES